MTTGDWVLLAALSLFGMQMNANNVAWHVPRWVFWLAVLVICLGALLVRALHE